MGDRGPGAHFHSHPLQRPMGIGGQAFGQAGQDAGTRLDKHNPRPPRVDAAKIQRHGEARQFVQGTRQFDARRTAADDDEGHQTLTLGVIFRQFGRFECHEDAPTDVGRILDPLQAGATSAHSG